MIVNKSQLSNVIVFTTGFILSPLSWWNDLVINVPLAYLISAPFSIIDEALFLPAFVFAYWLTNLLGFLMMHWSGEQLSGRNKNSLTMKHSIIVSIAYSVIMVIIVSMGWLSPPTDYLR